MTGLVVREDMWSLRFRNASKAQGPQATAQCSGAAGQKGKNVNPSWNDVGMSWLLALVVVLALIA